MQEMPAGVWRVESAGRIGTFYLNGAAARMHPAVGSRGVVIVGGFGYEDLCSRQTLGLLADGLAAAGLPTLRLDLRATGDSVDLPEKVDRVSAWCDDIATALNFMRAQPTVAEVVLVGFRLGAVLAPFAAAQSGSVDHLVLMAPPASGRAHGRELRILARLLDPTGKLSEEAAEDISVGGFHMSAKTLESLTQLDLDRLDPCPARRLTLVGDPGSGALTRLGERWRTGDLEPNLLTFNGYSQMMCDPTASTPAYATIADVIADLSADLPPRRAAASHGSVECQSAATLAGPSWIEEPVAFADGLAGILCRPPTVGAATRAALWLNSGLNYHIGWARQTVDISRQLASAGVAVFRIDFAGIGESLPRVATPAVPLYHSDAQTDVAASIDELQRRGFRDIALIGQCSGGHQAFHAAAQDRRISRLILVNILCFIANSETLAEFTAWMQGRTAGFTSELRQAEALEAEAESSGPRGALVRRARLLARTAKSWVIRLRAAVGAPALGPVVARFREFSARGLHVLIVLSDGDKAVVELERHAGIGARSVARLPRVEIVRLADADHSLSSRAARRIFGNKLVAFLSGGPSPTTRPQPAPATAAARSLPQCRVATPPGRNDLTTAAGRRPNVSRG